MNTTEHFQEGDKVLCIANGNGYDGANRVFKGRFYTVKSVINNNEEKFNGEICETGLLVYPFGEEMRADYPYVWNKNRFRIVKEVIDNIQKPATLVVDQFGW